MRINKLKINGSEINLSNVIIIIGGNNSGKTKFLHSIYDEFTNLVEWENGEYGRSTSKDNYWPDMLEPGYFSFNEDELRGWVDALEYWKNRQDGPIVGNIYRSNKHILQYLGAEGTAIGERAYNDLKANRRSNPPGSELDWILPFKKSHTQELSVEQRISDSNSLSGINISDENSPYIHYTNNLVSNSINKHLMSLFNRKLYLTMITTTNYALIATTPGNKSLPIWPKAFTPHKAFRVAAKHKLYFDGHREEHITEQSHGTRATLSLLMALTDNTRKILFIDEPELHLYPTARNYIAKLIASYSNSRQVFMVTHDPLIIDGIANSGKNFTVIKIKRNYAVTSVNFNTAQRQRTASELKNNQAVRAGFLDAALFVEGINDKYVYSSIMSRKKLINPSLEFGVVDCGGNDKISDHIKFAYDTGTKVAVIVDFDTLCNKKEVRSRGEKLPIIIPIMDALKLPDDLIADAINLQPKLKLNHMTKSGVKTEGLDKAIIDETNNIINKLSSYGVFVVPHGELFDWFNARKSKNNQYPEWLRNKYYNNAKKYPEITSFLKKNIRLFKRYGIIDID